MNQLYYATGNESKFSNASKLFKDNGVDLHQLVVKLDEIQSDSSEDIALKKVRQAYIAKQSPLFVNDASWHIPALGGFPGPFMKYITQWFKTEDILNLMKDKSDRTIVLKDVIAYKDSTQEKIFVREAQGTLLEAPEGEPNGPFVTQLISFSYDGRSLASVRSVGYTERELPLWEEFIDWLKSQPA